MEAELDFISQGLTDRMRFAERGGARTTCVVLNGCGGITGNVVAGCGKDIITAPAGYYQ